MKNPFSRHAKKTAESQSKGFSLQTKLLALLLSVSLLPVLVGAWISINQTRDALGKAAQASLRAGAGQVAAALDATIKSNLDSIRTEAQQDIFVNYLKLSPFERSQPGASDAIRYELTVLSLKEPTYILSYALVDLDGTVLADTVDANVGKSEKLNDYFSNVLNSQVSYLSPVTYNENGTLILDFAAPVRDDTGAIIGVLRSQYRAAMLQELVEKTIQESGQNISVSIFDNYNIRIVDSSQPGLVQKSLVPLSPEVYKAAVAERRLLPGTPEEQSTNNTTYNTALNSSDSTPFFVVDTTDSTSGTSAVAVAPLKTMPWKVAYSQPEALFLSDVQKQTGTNVIILLTVAVFMSMIAIISSRQITNPIKELSNVAAMITGGELNMRAQINRTDEIGALAIAFNLMTGRLQEILGDLEQRVADRTKALSSVAEVATAASTILETDKLLQQVVDLAKERFGLYHAHIYLLNEAGDTLALSAGADEVGRQMVGEGRSIPLDIEQSLVARAAREKKGVTVNDVTKAPDFLPNPLLPDTRSEMAVPMMVGDQVIGVLDVQSEIVGRFTDADIAVQTTLASQIASAVQNSRSYTKVWEAQQLTRTIIDSTEDWIFVKDHNHRYVLVNQGYSNSLHIPIDDFIGKDDLDLGFPEELVKGNPTAGIRGFWADDNAVLETGKPQHYPDDPATIDGVIHIFDTLKVPLRDANDNVWAVLGYARDVTEREHNSELNKLHAQQQEAINEIAQKIQSTTTIESALQIAARELGHLFGKKTVAISLDVDALDVDETKSQPMTEGSQHGMRGTYDD